MNDKRKSGVERRQERQFRETKEKKKIRLIAITVVIVLAVLFCCAMLINSSYIRRSNSVAAVSAGGLTLSAAEFDYFFFSAYNEYRMYQYYDSTLSMPSTDRPLKSQVIDASTGETWHDFFVSLAMSRIAEIAAYYDEANKAGFTLPDDKRAELEETLASMGDEAASYGYHSTDEYLQAYNGPYMNEKTMRGIYELLYTTESFLEQTRDAYSYTNEENTAYYEENKDNLDVFNYRSFLVKPVTLEEADYETAEEYGQAQADALAEAVTQAETIAAGITSEQDFIDAARAYDGEAYELDASTLQHSVGKNLGEDRGPWYYAPERVYGEVTTFEASTVGCYVQMFIDRSSNDYQMVNLRQLVIKPEVVSESDYPDNEAAYNAALEDAKNAAREKATLVVAALEVDGRTEDAFVSLIAQHSDDATEGGLLENVYRYETGGDRDVALAAEVNEWPFIAERSVGDYAIVEGADGTQYILFLSSFGDMYNWYLADTGMRDRDFEAWKAELTRPEVKKHWAYKLTQ